jgi:hypothetical protein
MTDDSAAGIFDPPPEPPANDKAGEDSPNSDGDDGAGGRPETDGTRRRERRMMEDVGKLIDAKLAELGEANDQKRASKSQADILAEEVRELRAEADKRARHDAARSSGARSPAIVAKLLDGVEESRWDDELADLRETAPELFGASRQGAPSSDGAKSDKGPQMAADAGDKYLRSLVGLD